jgi:hypothetical protein
LPPAPTPCASAIGMQRGAVLTGTPRRRGRTGSG